MEAIINIKKAISEGNKLIAIVGHGGVGKTTFIGKLKEAFVDDEVNIVDDIYMYRDRSKPVIYSDFRALSYLKGEHIDEVYVFRSSESHRLKARPQCEDNRSEEVEGDIDRVYYVEKHF
jgi:GTPase SAR1 family protein